MIIDDSIFKEAWATLFKVFSEQCRKDEMNLMDSVLSSVVNDREEQLIEKMQLMERNK